MVTLVVLAWRRNGCECRPPTVWCTAVAESTGTCSGHGRWKRHSSPTARTRACRSAPPRRLCDDGRIVVGCNVENASYGVGLCAECTMAGQLRLTGGGRFVAVACRSGTGDLLMPCGRCRQVLYELGGP